MKIEVDGIRCAACKTNIEKKISSLDNVTDCNVSLLSNTLEVNGMITKDEVIKNLQSLGYDIKKDKKKNKFKKFIISLILFIPLFYLSMGSMIGLPNLINDILIKASIEALLALIILIINKDYIIYGFKHLIKRSPNMDSLIFISTTLSYLYSLYLLISAFINHNNIDSLHHGLYFESSAMIVVIITLGKFLEEKAKDKTKKSLQELAMKLPKVVKMKDGSIKDIDDVKVNDIIIVQEYECIPVDGIIIDGQSDIDESLISGESLPVLKKINEHVVSGSYNGSSTICIKVLKEAKDSVLTQMIDMVYKASNSKAKIARIADKLSLIFVPIVLAIALITFIVWMIISQDVSSSLSYTIAVIVISCPCALGLATPVAIMTGVGRGASDGILFKDAESLEKLANVKAIVLDKTGTISEGKLKIKRIIGSQDSLGIIKSLELKSSHLYSRSFKDLKVETYDVLDYQSHLGKGIEGKINNKRYLLGNEKLMIENGIELPDVKLNPLEIPLYLASDKLDSIVILEDEISEETIKYLKILSQHYDLYLYSGDKQSVVESTAKLLNIKNYQGELSPLGKYELVKKINQKTLFIGDGSNDALAMKEAYTSMTLKEGTDLAIFSSDTILVKHSIKDLYHALNLAKKTYRIIKENLFWALIYNVIFIPVAAGVFSNVGFTLHPMIAATLMSISSLFVVSNALRIYSRKKEKVMEVKVNGMMCEHCEKTVRDALVKKGYEVNEVSHIKGIVSFNKDYDVKRIKKIINKLGYKVLD